MAIPNVFRVRQALKGRKSQMWSRQSGRSWSRLALNARIKPGQTIAVTVAPAAGASPE